MRPLRLLCLLAVVAFAALALSSAAHAQAEAPVRVRLFGAASPDAVSVRGPATVTVDGRAVGRLSPGAAAQISRRGAGVRIGGAGLDAEGQTVELAPDGPAGRIHVTGGRAAVDVTGRIVALGVGSQLVVVNHVPMPDYVASVVASEYGFSEIEGVKAQAVLARTYAARSAAPRRPYDLDDDQRSQVYRGAGVVTPTSARGEAETRGQILTYRGAPAEAVYSSSSGGHTADNEAVWGTTPVPYLRGVPDPYDAGAPDHSWRTTADAARVHGALSRRNGGQVSGVYVTESTREGRAVRVHLVGARQETVSGSDFRTIVNGSLGWRTVRSTKFRVSLQGGQYVFDGGGFGHGVGMSQYGARGQARAGRSYTEILAFYFQGTDVTGAGPAYASAGPPSATRGASFPSPRTPRTAPAAAPSAAPSAPAPPRRGRGEAFVVRDPQAAPAATAAAPAAAPAAPSADGRRWPTPRRAAW